MISKTINIQLLTPVWTGNSAKGPDGLKLSGVLGSMRYMFEGLVRMANSHTCDINTDEKQCNFEKDKRICPACALFGCSGLSRAFKIDWDVPTYTDGIIFPESDSIPRFRNRHANEELYKGDTSIAKWLRDTLQGIPSTQIKPAFSTKPIPMKIIQLRKIPGVDIFKLLAGLLTFMSDYYAIGAKVNQGWGFFEIPEFERVELEDFEDELNKLINLYSFDKGWDSDFLDAGTLSYFDPIEFSCKIFKSQKEVSGIRHTDNLGLVWPTDPYSKNFVAAGFALQYRLRRILKFFDFDKTDMDPECYDDMLGRSDKWNKGNPNAEHSYKPRHRVPWAKEGAFAEYLFGTSAGDKHAGRIGVSHPYKKEGKWYVRMISQAENWEDAEPFYEILKDQLTRSQF